MKVLIELEENVLAKLLDIRATPKRGFYDWSLSCLLSEAIIEFVDKYGTEVKK